MSRKVRLVLELDAREHLIMRHIAQRAEERAESPEVAEVARAFFAALEGRPAPRGARSIVAVAHGSSGDASRRREVSPAAGRPRRIQGAPRSAKDLDEALAASRHADPRKVIVLRSALDVRPDARLQVLVSLTDVRRRASLPQAVFDAAVLELAAEDAIILHQHDHPAGLSPAERAQLVADERGNHFIGLVWTPKADRYLTA